MMNRKTEHTRESDLDYYQRRYSEELKDNYHKLQISDATFRCPFCLNKDYYSLTDLLRHASRIVADVHGETVKEIAKHSVLVRYLDSKISENKSNDMNVDDTVKSLNGNATQDELFVWPWVVVLANNVAKFDPKSGKYLRKSKKEIQEELLVKGFRPLNVTPKWNSGGQTEFVIVEFGKEWDAFVNAFNLERRFEEEHCGKRDYFGLKEQGRGDKLFGWMARSDDYNFRNIVGYHLREKGDLKTISGKEDEDNRKALKLKSSLENTLKQKKKELEEITRKCDEKVDIKPVAEASKRKFSDEENWKASKIRHDDERKMKATQWCSQLDDYQGNSKEILDENDEKQWTWSKQRKEC
ncbi:protein INVOLVED IN DE NOVO 2-like [Vicia villosa]|uniref:protein INVOLVED IN DE NOVO 2-like n=1 Tax=Vicia villosa TaxID=3911 RepID=UPI00273B7B56|nr:protein INVOLVED IN DE NOVO 2-like [Vicia villosa]